jgi:DHA1 family bicyclomycin/chloramphenicol resistance-like MFS transporter
MSQPSVAPVKSDHASLSLIILLGSLTAFDPLSIDMYLPAFPQMAKDLHTSTSMVQLSLTSFFIGMTFGQLIYGPLSDHYGRKKPLIGGMSIFLLATFGCAFSHNIKMLIVFRVLQALGGCAGMVIARAVVRDLFDKQQVAHVFSILMLVMGLAPILAPLAGGYLTEYFGWRAIFGALGAFCVVILLCTAFYLPETRRAGEGRLQLSSTFRVYGELFQDRHFLGYALTGSAIYAGLFAYITGSPFVLITLFGLRPDRYAWVFGVNALGIIAFSQVNRLLLRQFQSEQILRFFVRGSALFSIAVFAGALFGHHLYALLIPLFLFVAVNGLIFPNSAATALAHQAHRAGTASSLMGMLQWAVAFLSSFLVSIFDNGTAFPMIGVILGAGLFGALVLQTIAAKKTASHLTIVPDDAKLSYEPD